MGKSGAIFYSLAMRLYSLQIRNISKVKFYTKYKLISLNNVGFANKVKVENLTAFYTMLALLA